VENSAKKGWAGRASTRVGTATPIEGAAESAMPEARSDPRAPDLLVVYGTLRSGTGWRERLGVEDLVESVGRCRLAGSLFELGWYPGLVLDGGGPVVAEVLRLLDPSILEAFDRFEGYDPTRPEAGEYRRRSIEVVVELDDDPDDDPPDDPHAAADPGRRKPVTAWVYELGSVPTGAARIEGGDWLSHAGRLHG
jgi:gamma-glutamylcyclotransferase (GGCT)/AIG2-like uncharacterized protein YtfP